MDEKLAKVVEDEAALWSGVAVPNAVAREMTARIDDVIKGFEALRGAMAFEDEPSSFEAALQATKE